MRKPAAPSLAKIAQAKLIYDGNAPIAEVCALLGMNAKQFRDFRIRENWPMRPSPFAKRDADAESAGPPTPSGDLIARLEDAVQREFARAEAALDKHTPKTIEQSARTLASLVKTLGELKRMRRETDDGARDDDRDDDVDPPPRDLAELRAELARRLERLGGGGPAR